MSAVETFVLQLARVAKRGSWHLRGLGAADRDDVVAAALLWCWEHRAEFDQHVMPLDKWFAERLKAARRQRRRPPAASSLHALVADDDTERHAAARAAVEWLERSLTSQDRSIAHALGKGLSIRATADRVGVSKDAVHEFRKRIRKVRDLLPGERIMLTPQRPMSDEDWREATAIDHALAALISGPRIGKECPPCWRCCWFLGFIPDPKTYQPTTLADDEVQTAVRATERRKIEIANEIRHSAVALDNFDFQEDPTDDELHSGE